MLKPIGIAGFALLCFLPGARGESHFWLSTDSTGVSGPEAPAESPSVGETVTFYLWGRPESGRQFEGISLDVVASASGVDFVDGSFAFYNTIDGSTDRFEFTADSATTPSVVSYATAGDILSFGDIDDLIGMRGFSLADSTSYRGPGPYCVTGEVGCEVAGDSNPAWLIASFDVDAVQAGSYDLYLQIGDRGVVERTLASGDYDLDGTVGPADHAAWAGAFDSDYDPADGNRDGVVDAADYTVWRDHQGDTAVSLTAADSGVRFGLDSMGGDEPLYNASTDKMTTLGGDDPDATLTIAAPAMAVPEPSALLLALLPLLIKIRRRGPTGS